VAKVCPRSGRGVGNKWPGVAEGWPKSDRGEANEWLRSGNEWLMSGREVSEEWQIFIIRREEGGCRKAGDWKEEGERGNMEQGERK